MNEIIEKIVNAWWKERNEVSKFIDKNTSTFYDFDEFKIVLATLLPDYKFYMEHQQWFIAHKNQSMF